MVRHRLNSCSCHSADMVLGRSSDEVYVRGRYPDAYPARQGRCSYVSVLFILYILRSPPYFEISHNVYILYI